MESHSVYVSIVTVYGAGGVIWASMGLLTFLARARQSKRWADPFLKVTVSGCVWALIAWGIYGISSDALSSQFSRYMLFYFVTLIDRAHALAAQDRFGSVPLTARGLMPARC
jgi:hypothetical protein